MRALEDAGARFTFGIPGTHNSELYDALERSGRVTPVRAAARHVAGAISGKPRED